MSQINQIKGSDVGKNTISLEEKTVQEWLNEDEDDNIVVLYLNQIYLLNLKQINRILVIGTKEYEECGKNDDELYYDLKDIGIPGVACKTSQLDRLMFNSNMMERVNSCFVITANSENPRRSQQRLQDEVRNILFEYIPLDGNELENVSFVGDRSNKSVTV
jgi:hypothetical protein